MSKSKHYRSFVILINLVMVISSLLMLNVKANPIPYPTEPNTESPTLKVESPKNEEIYDENSIELVFSITKPESWNSYWLGDEGFPVIGDYWIYIYLNGELNTNQYSPNIRDVHTTNYSIVLEELKRGRHTITIDLEPRTFYLNPDPGLQELDYYSNQLDTISEMIQVRITSDLDPSLDPTPTPPKEPLTQPLALEPIIGLIAIISIIGFGILTYYKKYRK